MVKTIREMREKDQFFTKEEVAKECIEITEHYVDLIKSSLDHLFYVEPSAGNGDFYKNLSTKNKVAFDIEKPKHISNLYSSYVEANFLEVDYMWRNGIYVGNPPFGKRGKKAFEFILRCIYLDASIIAFILPPNINTKARINQIQEEGYEIVFHKKLPERSFYFDNVDTTSDMAAESIFQIYMKKEYIAKYNIDVIKGINLKNNDFVQVYTINDNTIKNSNRDTEESEFIQEGIGRKWIGKCDFYIPLRVFSSNGNIQSYEDFSDSDMSNIGFGIICKDKDIKNKIELRNCYTVGTNDVYISKKQLILKEIMRVYSTEKK